MIKTMYDSVNALAIPSTAEMVAGYVTGEFAWEAGIWGRWPRVREVHIDVNGTYPQDADVLDIERGAASPSQARAWIKERVKYGRAALYFSRSGIPEIEAVIKGLPPVDVWIADWTDAAHVVPVPASMHLVAVQYANTPSFDLSAVYDSTWPWR